MVSFVTRLWVKFAKLSLPVDTDVFGLPYSVCSVCGLSIHRRVPVVVKKYHRVGCGQGNSKTTCSGAQDESKNIWIGLKFCHHLVSVSDISAAIEPKETVAFPQQEFLEYVQHFCHLAENQDSVTLGLEF